MLLLCRTNPKPYAFVLKPLNEQAVTRKICAVRNQLFLALLGAANPTQPKLSLSRYLCSGTLLALNSEWDKSSLTTMVNMRMKMSRTLLTVAATLQRLRIFGEYTKM